MPVAIVTDTTHYAPPEFVAEQGIHEVSLYVNEGGNAIRESEIVDYEQFYDGDGSFSTALGLTSQPVTLFVRPDGTIMKQTGEIDLAEIRSSVAELLVAPRATGVTG